MDKTFDKNGSGMMQTEDNNTKMSETKAESTQNELVNKGMKDPGSNTKICDSEMLTHALATDNTCDDSELIVESTTVEEINDMPDKKPRKNRIIDDASDSEDEPSEIDINKEGDMDIPSYNKPALDSDDENNTNEEKPKRKTFKLIDSDSEDDSGTTHIKDHIETELEKEISHVDNTNGNQKKPFKLIDSDSEPEYDNNEDSVQRNHEPVYTLNSKKELVPEKSIAETLAELCDEESSEDEDRRIKPLAYKKKTKKKNDELHERKMTAKEAAEQRKEIDSVSQKMVRESHVSLPYHKPKQRSLKEFLQQRPRFASTIPDEVRKGSAGGIRMSTEQLLLVSKKMEERQKQVEEFYKSESDEEEETAVVIADKSEESSVVNEVKSDDVLTNNEDTQITNVPSTPNEVDGTATLLDASENLKLPEIAVETGEIHEFITNMSNNSEDLEKDASAEYEFNISSSEDEDGSSELIKATKFDVNTDKSITSTEKVQDNELKSLTTATNGNEENLMEVEEAITAQEDTKTAEDDEKMSEEQTNKKKIEVLSHYKINSPTIDGKLLNIQPKLSGAPNYVIDLEEGTTKLDNVTQLMQRFAKHACKKTLQKKPSDVELDVMFVSQGGDIHKEKVAMRMQESEQLVIPHKPGVQLNKLRNNLQKQMAQKREELRREKQLRQQKEKLEQEENDIYNGEKENCGGIDEILDDEEEEFSDIESTDDEDGDDDEEEKQNAEAEKIFIEGEAEEEEIDDEYESADNTQDDEDDNVIAPKIKPISRKPPLKRILQPVDSDSEEENTVEDNLEEGRQMDSTVSWPDDDDALVPAGQTNSCRTPIKPVIQSKSELGFLSPVCRLTGLQSFDATGKYLQNSPGSPAIKLGEPSPFKNNTWSKSLFDQSPLKTSEVLEEESTEKLNYSSLIESQPEPSTQDLMELCSGNFGFTQSDNIEIKKDDNCLLKNQTTIKENATAGLKTNSESRREQEVISPRVAIEEAKIDDEDDRFISQLIDEEELATFKKKFESPCETECNRTLPNSALAAKILFDAEQEDEDDDDDDINITAKGKRNNLVDSDEEDDEDERATDTEIELHDIDEDLDEEVDEIDKAETELGYDSEENEVVVEQPKKKLRMKDFLENEAELSESEWGSEDEDENHLDVMEMEEGDKEKFNERKLRNELERIHMRQILDKDKRDIKALQELLMDEDEELAGAGRQRQFKWSNLENIENAESNNLLDPDASHLVEDDENEEEWRRMRFERDLFIKSQKENENTENTTNEAVPLINTKSQVFKLGQRAILKNQISTKKTPLINTKQAYMLNTQRGSFLSRKDEVLTRVAEYTKVADINIGSAKNSRNFVFQTVEKTTSSAGSSTFEDKKRKAADAGTPANLKRLRLNGLSPAGQQKKNESRSKARLFNNSQW